MAHTAPEGNVVMFDREFFETTLGKHVSEKAKYSDGSVTVQVRLSTGDTLSIMRVLEPAAGCVIVEIYPQSGKLRRYPKEERALGAPQFDFDRLAIAYGVIVDVLITGRSPKNQNIGFQPT